MTKKHKNLTTKKQKFISYLKILITDRPSTDEVIKDVGISLSTYYRWVNDENLLAMAKKEKQKEFEEGITDVLQALYKKALQGDSQAIKIYLERIEKHHRLNILELTPDERIVLARMKVARENDI